MKAILCFCVMVFAIPFSQAQQLQNEVELKPIPVQIIDDLTHSKYPGAPKSVSCGPDTVQYTSAKATAFPPLELNNLTSGSAISQYYNCPQPITLSGATFFAYKMNLSGGVSVNTTVEVYLAGTDSMPTGAPLASATIAIDTTFGGGQLSVIQKEVNFTPITVSAPYVMVFENDNPNGVGFVVNDWFAVDGADEWLSSAKIGGTWMRSYVLNVGGSPFNCDAILMPHASYTLYASFSHDAPTCMAGPTTVNYTNASSPVLFDRMYSAAAFAGIPEAQILWDFDDGNFSSVIDPTHNYAQTGNYNVTLTDSMQGWTTLCNHDTTITLLGAVQAMFSSVTTAGQVDFTDASIGPATSWFWDFGDGNTSTQQNPTHNYTADGTYIVCLTVNNASCVHTWCDTITICLASASSGWTNSMNNLVVDFTDASTGAPTSWFWDFGDGNTSTQQNPQHTYTAAGTYTVCLGASNACSSDTSCTVITVTCPTGTAGFTNSSTDLAVAFTDASTGTPTSWSWDFGDGNTSTQQNPTHTYTSPGTYTVCLTISDQCGTDTLCQSVTVTCPTGTAGFTNSPTDLVVAFTDASTGTPTSWSWDFGDGNTSTQQNPTHTYSAPGTYIVCLTISDQCGTDTLCQSVTVTCTPGTAAFTSSAVVLMVDFTDQSTGSPTSWFWDFGDGNTSTQQNPTHVYTATGLYTVCLTITDACGADSVCNDITLIGTGIGEQLQPELSVWPSPAREQINLSISGWEGKRVNVDLMNLTGQQIIHRNMVMLNGAISLDVNHLAESVYLLQVSDGEFTFTKKVVISRQ